MTGGLTRALRLERLVGTIDDPGRFAPADRPAPAPPLAVRPKRIAVTDLDRLKADPVAFYAKTVLGLRPLEPVDADHTAAWKGSAVHRILEDWFREDDCDPERILPRARALVAGDDIHPMLRALWAPRLEEAVRWLAEAIAEDREAGRRPLIAEVAGEAVIAGVTLYGRVDRIDRLADDKLAIVDYKTGKAPSGKAVREGFALQLGLLGLIAEHGGFAGASGESGAHEYWSLARKNGGSIGYRSAADEEMGAEAFLAHAAHHFAEAAGAWLTGSAPFTAKLHPAYAPYGDYDQMMRLDEWYGRVD
jgi:ATP-dependent helicase/nuclease subunit B